MTAQIALFDDPLVSQECPAHASTLGILIPDSSHLSLEEIQDLIPLNGVVRLYTTWPERNWGKHAIGDIYRYFKPLQIGDVVPQKFVKGNQGWVLHGRVYYTGGKHLNHTVLGAPRAIVLSVDIERGDPSVGRKAIGLDRLVVSPK